MSVSFVAAYNIVYFYREMNGLLEVECSIEIDLRILNNILLYKYFVTNDTSHDAETNKNGYEYLHGAPGGDKIKDRVLWVSKEEAIGKIMDSVCFIKSLPLIPQ